ncbi:IS3 family transposase [Halomonas elongata]|uniref:IS3 family transposase n=1 Tax=Halomonas elongata TaxID=2746 RepID=UPI00384B65D5
MWWRSRQPSAREASDNALMARIKTSHAWSDDTYGGRIHAEFVDAGWRASSKRIARFMHQARLRGIYRQRRITTTHRSPDSVKRPDLAKRQFAAAQPNHLVCSRHHLHPDRGDHTVTWQSCWQPSAVGSSAGPWRRTWRSGWSWMRWTWRRPHQVIHHCDQGAQYTSTAFGERCDRLCRPGAVRGTAFGGRPQAKAVYRPLHRGNSKAWCRCTGSRTTSATPPST